MDADPPPDSPLSWVAEGSGEEREGRGNGWPWGAGTGPDPARPVAPLATVTSLAFPSSVGADQVLNAGKSPRGHDEEDDESTSFVI